MDNDHAHPPPTTTQQDSRPVRRPDHTPPKSSPPQNRQQRLLRSRNARFPAKKLSISNISARLSGLVRTSENQSSTSTPTRVRKRDTALHRSRGSDRDSNSTLSSFGVLGEITNSIGISGRRTAKKGYRAIENTTPERALLEESPTGSPSIYHDAASAVLSPSVYAPRHTYSQDMGLREVSGNAQRGSPRESALFSGAPRTGQRRKSVWQSRYDTEEYIEHIEKELELVKEAMLSPTTSRPWKEKLKSTKIENDRLRKEINDLRISFESEVQRTVEHMTTTEVDLRRRIRLLEDEVEHKDFTIHELQAQREERSFDQATVDILKATIDRLEYEKYSLEETNKTISKRNDVLTQLLAFSPTKLHDDDEFATPLQRRKGSRPLSMMTPRLQSSPILKTSRRPLSYIGSTANSSMSYFSPRPSTTRLISNELIDNSDKHGDDNGSIDSGLGDSCSVHSASGTLSRRSTFASQGQFSPSAWGLPLPASPTADEDQAVTQKPTRRRTRKFLPGSTQLKPLLLASLSAENNSHEITSPTFVRNQVQRRDVTEESIDPTTTFLSKYSDSDECESSPWSPKPRNSAGSALRDRGLAIQHLDDFQALQEVADGFCTSPAQYADHVELDRLESEPNETEHEGYTASSESLLDLGVADVAEPQLEPGSLSESTSKHDCHEQGLVSDQNSGFASSPTHERFEFPSELTPLRDFLYTNDRKISVEMPQPLFASSPNRNKIPPERPHPPYQSYSYHVTPTIQPCTPPTRHKRRNSSYSRIAIEHEHTPFGVSETMNADDSPSRAILAPVSVVKRAVTPEPEPCLATEAASPFNSGSPIHLLRNKQFLSRPIVSVTIQTIYGTLSRYTSYIRDFRRDPLALARRVIANAWISNWKMFGKLSWWVLGLFLGQDNVRRENQAWDWDDYDVGNIAAQHCHNFDYDEQERLFEPTEITPLRHRERTQLRSNQGTIPVIETASKRKQSWGQSLYLWGKFSVAIMLAVTGAVVKGPAEMLRDIPECIATRANVSPIARTDEQPPIAEVSLVAQTDEQPLMPEMAVETALAGSADEECPSPSADHVLSPSPSIDRRQHKHRRIDTTSPFHLRSSSFHPTSSPLPAFRFGQKLPFQFGLSPIGHDWGDEQDLTTLKPGPTQRAAVPSFSPPTANDNCTMFQFPDPGDLYHNPLRSDGELIVDYADGNSV